MNEPKRFLREREVTVEFSLSAAWLRKQRWLQTGPPYVKAGGMILYERTELELWLAARVVRQHTSGANTAHLEGMAV